MIGRRSRHVGALATLLCATGVLAAQRYAPVAVTALDPDGVPSPYQRVDYPSFAIALQNLDFRPLSRPEIQGDPLALGVALQRLANGLPQAAMSDLAALQTATDNGIRAVAARMHMNLLFNKPSYEELLAFMDAAGSVDPSVRQLARLPAQQLSVLREPVSARLTLTPSDVPLLEVEANGQLQQFGFDTGAAFSVLRRGLANDLGVDIHDASITVGTSTEIKLNANYAVLGELRVGNVLIRNHAVLVLDDDALEFELANGTRFTLDGLVGWNAIRELRAELDYAAGSYQITLSSPNDYRTRNLFWLGYPLVRLLAGDGQPLLFGLDTGSRNTSITGNIFDKVGFGSIERHLETIGGAGGSQQVEADVVDRLMFIIGTHRFIVSLVRREEADDPFFVTVDGTLGSDIAQRCRITVDFPNAYFGIQLSAAADDPNLR